MLWGGKIERTAVQRQAAFLDDLFGAGTAAGVLAGLDDRAVSDGHPVWFDDGRPLEDLNEFLRGPYSLSTAAAYAGDIAELGRFLDERGKTLPGCSATDALDFKRARLGEVGLVRCSRQGTAISVYYRWLVATGRIDRSPIQRWPDANGRDRYVQHRRRQRLVPFLQADEYRWFRDECLGRVGDGVREPLFSDLAVESGARRSEVNRLSWIGLPDRHPGRNPCEVWVVGKGSKERQVFASWATLQKVLAYRPGRRADVVEASQAYLEGRLGVGELTLCHLSQPDRHGHPRVIFDGRPRCPLVDVADEVLARLVVRRDDGMLDPAALFVSTRGARMLDPPPNPTPHKPEAKTAASFGTPSDAIDGLVGLAGRPSVGADQASALEGGARCRSSRFGSYSRHRCWRPLSEPGPTRGRTLGAGVTAATSGGVRERITRRAGLGPPRPQGGRGGPE